MQLHTGCGLSPGHLPLSLSVLIRDRQTGTRVHVRLDMDPKGSREAVWWAVWVSLPPAQTWPAGLKVPGNRSTAKAKSSPCHQEPRL